MAVAVMLAATMKEGWVVGTDRIMKPRARMRKRTMI